MTWVLRPIFPPAYPPTLVNQDGSPHGRPAGRASLAGAARAVRAAGLVPVGVCNTSHDVLTLASEQGLPEVGCGGEGRGAIDGHLLWGWAGRTGS